jgi:peptide chain release factor 1
LIVIETKKAVRGFENEAGGHRIQRVPPTERRGRVHTSTVTVSVLSGEHHRDPIYDQREESDFEYRWFSGTGKGGQHRNKHQNCLEITHVPTGTKCSSTGRSREMNERDAMQVMVERLDKLAMGSGHEAQNDIRAAQIGCGMRGDKRRTYRFQDDAVVDHLTGKKISCKSFMRGDIEKIW